MTIHSYVEVDPGRLYTACISYLAEYDSILAEKREAAIQRQFKKKLFPAKNRAEALEKAKSEYGLSNPPWERRCGWYYEIEEISLATKTAMKTIGTKYVWISSDVNSRLFQYLFPDAEDQS